MKEILDRHRVITYIFVMAILSGIFLGLHGVLKEAGNYSISFPQYAQISTVVVMSLLLKDKSILKDILSRLMIKRKYLRYFWIPILVPIIMAAIMWVLLPYLGQPFVVWGNGWRFFATNLFFILLGCIGEEVGWRGYLLPLLQQRFSPFCSSIILGSIWGIWHMNVDYGIWGFIIYVINCICFSILLSWLFNKTEGNILLMIIWHFVNNACFHILLWDRNFITVFTVFDVMYLAVIMIGILKKSERRNPQISKADS